jgi:hypothetical protein
MKPLADTVCALCDGLFYLLCFTFLRRYLSGILRPDPDWKSWTSTSGKVKRHFYAEMVFQFKLSRDLARAQAGMRDGEGTGAEELAGGNESTDQSIDDDAMWDEDELKPAEECEKDLSDLVL